MSFIKDFREFREYKNGKRFNTSELFVADYGTISVTDGAIDGRPGYSYATFTPDRFLIVVEATQEEINSYCKKKYGGMYNTYFDGHQFENPRNTKYYKAVTMGGKLIPSITTKTILSNNNFERTHFGKYECTRETKSLNAVKNKNICLAHSLTLEDIYDLEDIINNTPTLSL